jgi:HK97 family phage major capsid protein
MATENSAVSETDIVESMIVSPVATVAGQQDLSQQLFDRADPPMVDIVLATDLGRSLGANFDQQVFTGTGANGQTFGLRAVAGITSNAYTDASPTQAEGFPVIAKTCSDVSTAVGAPATVIVMHPRRLAWFVNWKDTATGMQPNLNWPAQVVQVAAITTQDGAATNQDEIFVLRAEELPVFASPPAFRVKFDTTGSGNLIVRVTAFQYVATLFNRKPEAIGRSTGTGWAGVTFA